MNSKKELEIYRAIDSCEKALNVDPYLTISCEDDGSIFLEYETLDHSDVSGYYNVSHNIQIPKECVEQLMTWFATNCGK